MHACDLVPYCPSHTKSSAQLIAVQTGESSQLLLVCYQPNSCVCTSLQQEFFLTQRQPFIMHAVCVHMTLMFQVVILLANV